MDLKEIDIHTILPQRDPFVMIDTLVHFSSEKAVTEFRVRGDNLFVDNGEFTPYGITENIAQTCAAKIGYYNKYILQKDVQIGVIGAIRNLVIHRCPEIGAILTTTITTIEEIFGMTLVNAEVKNGDEKIAECEMKIAVRQNENDLNGE